MEDTAYAAAAGLDAYRYATATSPADLMFWDAVANRARQIRADDLAAVMWPGER